jgi:hypothetical protein
MGQLRQAVLQQIKNTTVIKVKMYSLDGLTVFSTEAAQVGEDQSANRGWLAARSGGVVSELTHRDRFNAVTSSRATFRCGVPTRAARSSASSRSTPT